MMVISQDHEGTFLTTDQEWKDFIVRKERIIARKFYRARIVPPSGVGLDHPTWKEVRFDHILMI